MHTVLFTSAFVTGIAAIAFGTFLLLSNGNGDAAPPPLDTASPSPTAGATFTPTPGPTDVPLPTETPAATSGSTPAVTPTPAPTLDFDAQIAVWSEVKSAWQSESLDASASDYAEGDLVPFLMRIDDAKPGTTYEIDITYDCGSADSPGLDFLSGIGGDDGLLLESPGPGRVTPDSALVLPDDPSIAFDDQQGSTLLAWGATFSLAAGPEPLTVCDGSKTLSISITARGTSVVLMWTGHLASPVDWGDGIGAASATPFGVTVAIDSVFEQSVGLLDGSVSP